MNLPKTLYFSLSAVAALLLGSLSFLTMTGCSGLSPSQLIASNGMAAGEAVGKTLLSKHSVNGVVDPAYLARYEAQVPKVANLMQGAITPADIHDLIADASGVTLTSGQSTVVAYLDGLSPEFIKSNGNPLTPDGAIAAAAAQQFSAGLARAVGFVTGTNFTPPAS